MNLTLEPEPGYHIHAMDPFLLRFPDGFFLDGIRWYGLAYVLAFAIAALLLHIYYRHGRSPLNTDQQTSLLTAIIIGVLGGGRLGYFLLYAPAELLQNPLVLLQVWQGGMASHGGMLGILAALLWFSRKYRQSFWQMADITVTLAPPGILLGRIANYINGELWGKATDVAWAVVFPVFDSGGRLIGYTPPVHPSQLYEALLEGLVLLLYLQARFWLGSCIRQRPGQLAAEALIAYAGLRIIGELFREPDAGLIFGLNRGIFYTLFMLLAGIILFYLRTRPKVPER